MIPVTLTANHVKHDYLLQSAFRGAIAEYGLVSLVQVLSAILVGGDTVEIPSAVRAEWMASIWGLMCMEASRDK